MSGSGTLSHSEVNGNLVVTVDVSARHYSKSCLVSALTHCLSAYLVLYEADRRAHEEAVQNGGVSHVLAPLVQLLVIHAHPSSLHL